MTVPPRPPLAFKEKEKKKGIDLTVASKTKPKITSTIEKITLADTERPSARKSDQAKLHLFGINCRSLTAY